MSARKPYEDVTAADLHNFMTGSDELKEAERAIRSLVDDDPIDLAKLERRLRDALAAIRRIKSSAICTDKLEETLNGHEKLNTALLEVIAGRAN